jgi:hypothetical protein
MLVGTSRVPLACLCSWASCEVMRISGSLTQSTPYQGYFLHCGLQVPCSDGRQMLSSRDLPGLSSAECHVTVQGQHRLQLGAPMR